MENCRMKLPLFDDSWIDFRTNTKRRWFAPELFSIAPSGAYSSLIYDPERQVYRLYFEVLIDPALHQRHCPSPCPPGAKELC